MDPFDLTGEEDALSRSIAEFGAGLNEGLAEREAQGFFTHDLWRRCGEFGLQGLPIPTEYGGSEQSLSQTARAMMALGRTCRDNGLVFSLNAQMWAFELPLLRFGTDEQRTRWLPPVCQGALVGAHAVTEARSGSDAFSMATRAVRDGDHYVLNGSKTFVTNGPVADVLIVFATVNPELRSAGVTGFLIERGTPGLTLSRPIPKMGLRSSPMGEVVLEDCRVPAANRLGGEGAGSAIFSSAMEWERTCIFAAHLGAMERLLEDSVRYAKEREQFGVRISQHPEVANRLVDMKVSIEAGRLLLLKAAAAKEAGRSAALHAAIAKLFVSEAHVRQALGAIQVHGGYGYTTEYGVERELRDAVPGTLYSGTSEMQRKLIARLMGL